MGEEEADEETDEEESERERRAGERWIFGGTKSCQDHRAAEEQSGGNGMHKRAVAEECASISASKHTHVGSMQIKIMNFRTSTSTQP